MRTVSVVVEAGVIVNVPLRDTPLRVALIVALLVDVTEVVLMLNVAEDEPAGTITLAGSEARVLLLARLTVVAAAADAFRVTLPWTVLPPTIEPGVSVNPDKVTAAVVDGVTRTVT